MATANVDYDVTPTILQAYLPQVGMEGAGDVLTTARLTIHIDGAAAEVNEVLIAAGIAPADVAAATSSVAYKQCQRAVVYLALPDILRAVGAHLQDQGALDAMRQRGRDMLDRWAKAPARLGFDDDTDYSPQLRTTTQILDLDAANEITDRARRMWDSDDDSKVHW